MCIVSFFISYEDMKLKQNGKVFLLFYGFLTQKEHFYDQNIW
ncbi:hypothetical protein HMPREF9420_1829 [Segatella salivae DSM 15606]|uniref:Uncharacterized protein n=1 Tax=Segatella salivae DSM 15606 TaxID=888832 RepID=E6MQR1_9BACT|nr:hypothetical protein HMPREF9420_1829 [Segatella salivae DSM 15606]